MSEQREYVDIHITGKNGEIPIVPANYDISELKDILTYAENLLYPNVPRTVRPVISYEMKEGSVIHRFCGTQGRVPVSGILFLGTGNRGTGSLT